MPATALSASLLPRWARLWATHQHVALRRSFLAMFAVVAIASIAISVLVLLLLGRFPLRDLGFGDAVAEMMQGLVWIIGPIGLHQLAGTALLSISRPLLRTLFDTAGLALLAGAFVSFYFQLGTRGLALACVLVESLVACMMAAAFLSSVSGSHGVAKMETDE
jgi:O-antigen/teichoic acid export membrane protein